MGSSKKTAVSTRKHHRKQHLVTQIFIAVAIVSTVKHLFTQIRRVVAIVSTVKQHLVTQIRRAVAIVSTMLTALLPHHDCCNLGDHLTQVLQRMLALG